MSHDPTIKPELLGNGGSDSPGPPDAALQERLRSVCRPFTCRELADLTHVSYESVRRYLGGQNPGVVFLKRLCEVLNISADWLLLGRGVPMFQSDTAPETIEGNIDRALETLGTYFKQLNIDLSRRSPAPPQCAGDETQPDSTQPPCDQTAGSFVPPSAFSPPIGPVRIRLLLGPANGKSMSFPDSPPEELLVRIDENAEAQQVGPDEPPDPCVFVYRRIMDRVYRWVSPNR